MLCDSTCVGADISAADVKHMIWKYQDAGVIFIFNYVNFIVFVHVSKTEL